MMLKIGFWISTSLRMLALGLAFTFFTPLRPAICLAADGPELSAESLRFFEQKVRPLLVEKCLECHSASVDKPDQIKGGLRLDSRQAVLSGGDNGAAAVPGNVDGSLLIKAVRYQDSSIVMPPDNKLKAGEIAILEEWVRLGLPMPNSQDAPKSRKSIDIAAGRNHWAFKPLHRQAIPFDADGWSQGFVDAFIRDQQKLLDTRPTPPLDRARLLRRTKFDLLGLPPSAEEIEEFVSDEAPDALERRVDHWLASPRYGERWARYWLELVRYCDIAESWAETAGNSYFYRDWTVKALNDDMPYDQFATLQLAADQTPDARPTDLAALGFIGMSPNYWKELQLPVDIIKTIVSDEYEERIHTFSSTFLGLNIACARCHDHKFDPITAHDYYALAGVFASTRVADRALAPNVDSLAVFEAHKNVTKWEAELKKAEASRKALVKLDANAKQNAANKANDKSTASTPTKSIEEIDDEREKKRGELTVQIEALQTKIADAKRIPGYDVPLAPGAMEGTLQVLAAVNTHGSRLTYAEAPIDAAVEIRGNPNKTGEPVPRRYVAVLSPDNPPQFQHGSGRYELARTMFESSGPLVARVMVNRLWKHHFGMGLVDTPSDFGVQGQPPTHPALLDELAGSFIDSGWSMKSEHRRLVLSACYQQSARQTNASEAQRKSYAGLPLRRLEVEQWRDAMLVACDKIDWTIAGPPSELSTVEHVRRTMYGTIRRRELTDVLRLNDFPDPLTHSPERSPTTTPLQQLYTLNSPFVEHWASALVDRLDREITDQGNLQLKITFAYRWIFGRMPSEKELRLGKAFVNEGARDRWLVYIQALMASNEFLFVD